MDMTYLKACLDAGNPLITAREASRWLEKGLPVRNRRAGRVYMLSQNGVVYEKGYNGDARPVDSSILPALWDDYEVACWDIALDFIPSETKNSAGGTRVPINTPGLPPDLKQPSPAAAWDITGYEMLAQILHDAYHQAAVGKGAERHANALPFDKQPMQTISGLLKTNAGLAFQAIKKIQEGQGLPSSDRRIREYLGAINYIAGMIIFEWNNAPKEASNG